MLGASSASRARTWRTALTSCSGETGGLVLATAGALLPAGRAARMPTAAALRTE